MKQIKTDEMQIDKELRYQETYTCFLYPIEFSLKQSFRVLVYPLHMTLELDGPLTVYRCPRCLFLSHWLSYGATKIRCRSRLASF